MSYKARLISSINHDLQKRLPAAKQIALTTLQDYPN